ncbi:putative ketoreductase [Protomyces lactucae-debilis]|uniref:Very-long-chain 3-oxoacyl-CoA reductase n=1 Tax=Protomyces lactucae-debilis TaxID=2754530 RepID=A0A1Y2F3T5_PROLT|nr:putative ketoreductase [Protomyces lactucae-debilis]ORY78532.1 putative ketoreductase [Protomyces lactucae-debilis]
MSQQIDYRATALHWVELARSSNAILALGLLTLFVLSYSASTFVADLVFPGTPLSKFGASKTDKKVWAVVTGASDGIGAEYATQLAQAGFNIVLVSRTQSKLDTLAGELESKYHISTKTLSMDASKATDKDFSKLAQLVQDLEVGVLINNVGQSHEIPVPFHQTEQAEMQAIIDINVTCTLRTTQTLLPKLMQRRSLILTMGSFGGFLPTPLLATYSGSKAFLQTWSTALASELADSKVTVKLVNSYLVTSKMSKVRKPTMTIPTPKVFVKAVLGGIKSGPVITPFWAHGLMAYALTWIGRESSVVVSGNKAMHLSIRKRALKKREKAQKGQ